MIEKEELLALIPHRGQMMLLSRVTGYNLEEWSLEAEYDLTEGCAFYDPARGGVSAWVGFELIAQAISALVGIWYREKGKKPNFGFILSVSSMKMEDPVFRIGNTAKIRVKEIEHVDMVFTFKGEVALEGKKALEGKLTVMDVDMNDERFKALLGGYGSIG